MMIINSIMDEKYHIIRGKRINNQLDDLVLFEQSTYVGLEQNVLNFIPKSTKRQNATDSIRVTKLETLPAIGMKTLSVWALTISPDSKFGSNTSYEPSIIFNQVEFENEDTQENITSKARDGNDYHIKPIILSKSTVRVHCQCLDFYWRFRDYNVKDKSAIARAKKPYKPISNRGPVNPQQKPGLCKHLLATVKALQHSGMVR